MEFLFLIFIFAYVEKSPLVTMLLGANFLFFTLFSLNGSLETSLNPGEASELGPHDSSNFIVGFNQPS